MTKHILAAAALAAGVLSASAQYDTMYLIKDNHVVGKYNVEDVDYASFTLPEGVEDSPIILGVDNVGKNTVTYTVTTVSPTTVYAHNILSFYDVEFTALSYFGESFDSLTDEQKVAALQYTLSYDAYIGGGTQTYKQTDFDLAGVDDYTRFKVTPGTKFYLCAWEVNPSDYSPLETFTYTDLKTLDPVESASAELNCSFVGQTKDGLQFDVTGSGIKYIKTVYGFADDMNAYKQIYGLDYLFGLFGQDWTLDELQGDDPDLGMPNATWPCYESGYYVLYLRAYDENGDYINKSVTATGEIVEEGEGPTITIFSKEKGAGSVKINFEIAPSNVEEAYVRLCSENFVDDRLNLQYELHEIAMGGDAEDITTEINTAGEYTFSANDLTEEWKSLLIYAKDKDGGRTTLRINFFPDPDSYWSIEDPKHAPARRAMPAVKSIKAKNNPTLKRVK